MNRLTVETLTKFTSGSYGDVSAYFVHTDHYVLISIPTWNWSFMWDFEGFDDEQLKEKCIKALSVPMFSEDAAEATERIHQYLLTGM